jgi:transketolase
VYPQVAEGALFGGYVLAEADGAPDVVLVATGSEVHLALEARDALDAEGVKARVVSMPCVEVFAGQSDEYRDSVLPEGIPIVAIEAGRTCGWKSYLGEGPVTVGIDRFGASAPGDTAMAELGMTVAAVVAAAKKAIG